MNVIQNSTCSLIVACLLQFDVASCVMAETAHREESCVFRLVGKLVRALYSNISKVAIDT